MADSVHTISAVEYASIALATVLDSTLRVNVVIVIIPINDRW